MSEPITISRRVAFSETDLAGVMHFSNYLRWMEDAEHAFWRSLDLSVHTRGDDGVISWPRVSASCEYLAPLRFEEQVSVTVRVERVGSKSLTFEFDFARDGTQVALGRMTAVCCRMSPGSFEAIPIPAHLRARLEQPGSGESGAAPGHALTESMGLDYD